VSIKNLEDLFVDKLKDIYDAERRITKALPKMVKSATSEELRSAFEEHLRQTEGQIERLDQIFEDLGMTPGRKPCHGMMGLLEEGRELMEEEAPSSVMDAGLISSAQEVEHYEIRPAFARLGYGPRVRRGQKEHRPYGEQVDASVAFCFRYSHGRRIMPSKSQIGEEEC